MKQNRHPIPDNVSSRPHRLGPMSLRGALGLLVVVVVMGLVGWMYLSQANESAETKRHIRELRQQKEELQRQNDQLTYENARVASVKRLETRARELGYVAVCQARFLVVAGYPVQDDDTSDETAALAQGDPTKHATSSAVVGWWKTVADQFEVWTQPDQP